MMWWKLTDLSPSLVLNSITFGDYGAWCINTTSAHTDYFPGVASCYCVLILISAYARGLFSCIMFWYINTIFCSSGLVWLDKPSNYSLLWFAWPILCATIQTSKTKVTDGLDQQPNDDICNKLYIMLWLRVAFYSNLIIHSWKVF